MTVTATDSTASASEAASVEAGATVKDRDLIDMTPAESEEAAETGSDDAEAFTSSGDESGFTDTVRISLYFYNSYEEIDKLVEALMDYKAIMEFVNK